jgi:ElaB/YqjD/DUF883 family membrane-anchored ribosome-binding protein
MTNFPNYQTAMNNPFSTPIDMEPDAGFTPTPSISQAATDLRTAAEGKVREIAHSAEHTAQGLKERAIGSAQHFREIAAEKASAFKATATDKALHLRENATEQWQDTRVKARELQITAEDYIRQNPTKCVISALVVGFLIGLIMRR